MTADGDAQVCASVVSVAMCYSILPVFDQWRRSQQKLKSFYGYYTKSGALCLRMEVDPTEILAFRYTFWGGTDQPRLSAAAQRRNVVRDTPICRAASATLILPFAVLETSSSRHSGRSSCGLPNRTPRDFAAAIPSRWRSLIWSRSVCATNESICNTKSERKTANRPCAAVVSSNGISSTLMWIPLSFVIQRHSPIMSS